MKLKSAIENQHGLIHVIIGPREVGKKTAVRQIAEKTNLTVLEKSADGESLAGRYKLWPFFHWSFAETNQLKSFTLENYLLYGGYPGSYNMTDDMVERLSYVKHSIVDPVIGKDILSLVHVKSPALFRQCFELVCSYASQEISYTKLLGQLQDKGNTDLVKHYL